MKQRNKSKKQNYHGGVIENTQVIQISVESTDKTAESVFQEQRFHNYNDKFAVNTNCASSFSQYKQHHGNKYHFSQRGGFKPLNHAVNPPFCTNYF